MTPIILAGIVISGLLINGLRLRTRVPLALPPAPSAAPPPAAATWNASPGTADREWAWLTAAGMAPDNATARAAVAYASAQELDLLEVVPGGLPVTTARDLLRRVDPRAYRNNRLAPGCGAGTAAMADLAMARRAGVDWASPSQPRGAQPGDLRPEDWQPGDYRPGDSRPGDYRPGDSRPGDSRQGMGQPAQAAGAEPTDVIAALRHLRPYARSRGAAITVAPQLRSGAVDLDKRLAWLRANSVRVPTYLAGDVVPFALTVAALATGWRWGLAAAATYCLQPYLIFAGTPLRPRGLHAAALLRPVEAPWTWARTVAGRWRSTADLDRDASMAEARAYYRAAIAEGTDRFLEPRRPDCSWCGSADLAEFLRVPDLAYHKPGMFTLERCGSCGHIFQNPRLTLEGLSFHYRDVYDGLGATDTEYLFAVQADSYLGRARMVAGVCTPKSWLDVEAGHAHFCVLAKDILPDTVFDGLDQGVSIEEAERRGWVGTGYLGEFPALAGELAGRYDIVSMHHYLEHTLDPRAELDAAAHVLRPGGHLLIEVPDPEWRLAPLLGRYWFSWFQPQHLNLISFGNLTTALAERGLRPVVIERGAAHISGDFVMTAILRVQRLAGTPTAAWAPRPPSAAALAWYTLVWTVGLPVIMASWLLDRTLVRALARRWDRGSAYRVLARREDEMAGHER